MRIVVALETMVMLPRVTFLVAHPDSSSRAGTAWIVSSKLLNMTEASVGTQAGPPFIHDNCNTYSAKLQERALLSTASLGQVTPAELEL